LRKKKDKGKVGDVVVRPANEAEVLKVASRLCETPCTGDGAGCKKMNPGKSKVLQFQIQN
jgi:hypothetical protein